MEVLQCLDDQLLLGVVSEAIGFKYFTLKEWLQVENINLAGL